MKNEAVEAAGQAASAGMKTAIAGGAWLSWGGWTSSDIAMIGGLVLGVLGLLVQIHFKRLEHKLRLAEHQMLCEEHDARMSELG